MRGISSKAAVVICDMWDVHHCATASRRTAAMAPYIDDVVRILRADGSLIIHAPGGCAAFYDGTPARVRAIEAPRAQAPDAIDWNDWEPDELADLPRSLTQPGRCMCRTKRPCDSGEPWTRQSAAIEIASEDAVTDDGQEVFNLLEQRGIVDVLIMGVHTNVCVLGRPYGIRQLIRLGMRPALCRDLTDAFHDDPRGYQWGTEQVVAHIERRWCPSVTSDQLVGGVPFAFDDEA